LAATPWMIYDRYDAIGMISDMMTLFLILIGSHGAAMPDFRTGGFWSGFTELHQIPFFL
jgi:hypothetical protein